MKSLGVGRYTLLSCAVAAMLAACGGSQAPTGAPGAVPQNVVGTPARATEHRIRPSSSYQVLYSFSARRARRLGGASPHAPLIAINGTMYGTAYAGGTKCRPRGCGTVYSISPTGAKEVIYKFLGGSNDGSAPTAGLIDVDGTFYGTTWYGGGSGCQSPYGCGIVYSVNPSGTETVLHKFTGGPYDGAYPDASLIDVNGTLYGTTSAGGNPTCNTQGCGTVYSITTSGSEKVLHAFGGGKDGYTPIGLLDVNGTIYGTTFGGGSGCKPNGCGTVYSIGTDGSKKTLHVFGGGSDGQGPNAALIDVKGWLYGTTGAGGTGCLGFGCGTVFSVSLRGKTKVLHQFAGGYTDGSLPHGLVYTNGMFYGTTQNGGSGCSNSYNLCGIAYSISTAGQETILHAFTGVPDGAYPRSTLIDLNGTLYGTTASGGERGCSGGCGTVFALIP